MSVKKTKFGTVGGKDVYMYTLCGKNGLCAEILTYGGIIKKLEYKGIDVVLGRNTMDEYLTNSGYFGAAIGRNSNRIANANFTINGKTYTLAQNNGKNNLHGGIVGFDKKVWDDEIADLAEPSIILSLISPDGEEGYPGTVNVKIQYTVKDDNTLEIRYSGESDENTVLNMTNHSYFNLNGHNSGSVEGHTLQLNADFYTPNNDECMPNGEILSVKGTPFDFTSPAVLGERLCSDYEQVKMFDGFDHNFVLRGFGYREVGSFTGDKSGITMKIYTDRIGLQFYTDNGTKNNRICKDGALYDTHAGACFETQAFPNFTNHSHFPGGFLKKGQKYETVTGFKFI